MRSTVFTFVLVLLLFSCKDNPVSEKIKETQQNVSNTTKAVKELNTMQDDIEALQKIEPLTNEELKAWLPDAVEGMKRTGFKAGQTSYIKIASIEATYATDAKDKQFQVQVIDGAGEMGAAATAGMRMLFSQEFEEEDEYRWRKTVKKDGMKAIEEYKKSDNYSEIQFMYDGRFYVKASGTNMSIDETWEAIDELDLNDLG
jgi:hypothetical protein